MGERIEWEVVPGDAPEWCARWSGLHLSVWKYYRDGWAWSVRSTTGATVECGTATSAHTAAYTASLDAARRVGCRDFTVEPLPPWPYAATDADPRGKDVPCVVREERERFASSPGSRVPPPAHVEAQPWVHGGHIVPADIDGVVEMAMKAFEPAQTVRIDGYDFPVPLPAPDPDFAAITDALGLPCGMTAVGVAAAARSLRAQRDRLERELAEAEREKVGLVEQVISLQFDLRGLQELLIDCADEPEAAKVRAPLTAKDACDIAGEMGHEAEEAQLRVWAALGLDDDATVDEMVEAAERLSKMPEAIESWRERVAHNAAELQAAAVRWKAKHDALAARLPPEPAPARNPRPLVCFKMPGEATDGRTFAACDDPTRHLDWSDGDE